MHSASTYPKHPDLIACCPSAPRPNLHHPTRPPRVLHRIIIPPLRILMNVQLCTNHVSNPLSVLLPPQQYLQDHSLYLPSPCTAPSASTLLPCTTFDLSTSATPSACRIALSSSGDDVSRERLIRKPSRICWREECSRAVSLAKAMRVARRRWR